VNSDKGLLVVISSPSGGGKTTVIRHLLNGGDARFTRSISMTTREPRPGEVDGKDYFFVDEESFKEKIAKGELVEYEQIHGYYYGTPKRALENQIERNLIVLMAIDVQGAFSIKKLFSRSFLIFLEPPDLVSLKERLIGRRTETSSEMEKRLTRASDEILLGQQFDFVIVNDHLQNTVKKIKEKILEKISQINQTGGF
jgi:guanylate kinase